jgi:alkaline phosphatase
MKLRLLFGTVMLLIVACVYGQGNYQWINKEDSVKIYHGSEKYQVKTFTQDFKAKKPQNIILMIGDGMGISHVFAGLTT